MEKRVRVIKKVVDTDPQYGCVPTRRPIETYIKHGVINLDKPRGPSSHQVVAWVKEILGIEKAGHGGTLDPNVTGVLPTALGESTKVVSNLLLGGKEYIGVMRLHRDIDHSKIYEVCKEFVGEIYQMVPVKSAVKRQLRTRIIYYLDILEFDGRNVLFKVGCQAGTYIRTLVRDLGEVLGVGAHMHELRRIRAGPFNERDAITLHELKDAYEFWRTDGDETELRRVILPMERIFDMMPKVVICDSAIDAICHGAPLAVPGIAEVDTGIKRDMRVAIMSLKGEAVAIGISKLSTEEIIASREGIAVVLLRVLMSPGTYPCRWKTTK